MSNQQPAASIALAGKFDVVGIVPGIVETIDHGRVDLRTIDLATAGKLVAGGRFPYLVAATPAPPAQQAAAAPATSRKAQKPKN